VSRAPAATTLLIGLAIAGCGSDDSGETTVPTFSIPAITSPIAPTATVPATTTAPTESTTTPKGGKTFNSKQPDSATNDRPPPGGSPQDAFEKQCEQNPKACG
jgi:hypothetical protein